VRGTIAALALLALAALAAYHNSFSGPFIFDDRPSIIENSDIRHFVTTLRENPETDSVTAVGRPLFRISLWMNYALGGLEVRGYHLFNLLLHLLGAFTLFSLARRILESPRLRDRYGEEAWGLALAIALLWTTHPLQTESVTYVVQRAEILGSWFYLLTLYGVARSAEAKGFRAVLAWTGAAVVSCLLGMASKETVATAPLLALAVDRIFYASSWKRLWQVRGGLYGALACTWILQAMLIVVSSGRKGSAGFGLTIHWWQYALTQPYFLCRYLLLSLWPRGLIFDYGIYLSQGAGEVAPFAAIVLLLGGLTLVALWRRPALGFCGLWFFLILAPTSSVVPITTQTGAEHRMYLPLAGLIGLGVVGVYALLRRTWQEAPGRLRAGCVLVLAVEVTALGARAMARNEEYRSEVSIWQTVVDRWPINPRAHYNLGDALGRAGRTPEAIAQLEEALRLKPDYVEAHIRLGHALVNAGRTPEAIAQLEEALRLKPDYVEAHNNPRNALVSAVAHNNLGNALLSAGRTSDAIAQFEEALRLRPDFFEAHNNLGNALLGAGRTSDAIAQFEEALRLRPDYAEVHYNLGSALSSAGRTSDAIAQFEEALRLKPDLGGGNLPEAIAELKAALLLQEEQRRSGSSGVAHAPGAAEATPK
jgi:Flp pilus assembly protein TadD